MSEKYKSKIFCLTEKKMVESPTWNLSIISKCPNNQSHQVDVSSAVIIETDPKTIFGSLKIKSLSGSPGRIFVDEIASSTAGGSVKIGNTRFFDDRLAIVAGKEPKSVDKGTIGFFIDDADNLLKTKNSDGKITVYQPVNSKGDLLTSDGDRQTRLPVGKDGSVLMTDSTAPSGLKWGTLATKALSELPQLTKKGDTFVFDGSTLKKFPVGNPGDILVADPVSEVGLSWQPRVIMWEFSEMKPQGVHGGTFLPGNWITRVLNTVNSKSSDDLNVVLDYKNSRIALKPGFYSINCSAPAFSVNQHAIRLQNVVDNTVVSTGTVEFSRLGATNSSRSQINTFLRVTGPVLLELQHRCISAKADNGLGIASGFQDEKYSTCLIVKYS